MRQLDAFGEVHLNAGGNHIIAALRFDDNRSEIRDPDPLFTNENSDSSQHYLNISTSLGLTRNLSGNTSIGLWLGRAQRSGNLTELYINCWEIRN